MPEPHPMLESSEGTIMSESPRRDKVRPKIVAVDGPAGSGKSSVCAKVCERIGWTYVNTGFLYRAIGYLILRDKIQGDDAIVGLVEDFSKKLIWNPKTQDVWYDGENLASHLYTDEIGQKASEVAKNPKLLTALLPLQRTLALQPETGSMVDGRDIGTVVFPDADLKIFLTASIEERARRRLMQLRQVTDRAEIDEQSKEFLDLRTSIAKRDQQDSKRGSAPLKQAEDAVMLDTSHMNQENVITAMINLLKEKGLVTAIK